MPEYIVTAGRNYTKEEIDKMKKVFKDLKVSNIINVIRVYLMWQEKKFARIKRN